MPRFAANLTMLFCELPFLDRFEAAKAAGFSGIEFLFPGEGGGSWGGCSRDGGGGFDRARLIRRY